MTSYNLRVRKPPSIEKQLALQLELLDIMSDDDDDEDYEPSRCLNSDSDDSYEDEGDQEEDLTNQEIVLLTNDQEILLPNNEENDMEV